MEAAVPFISREVVLVVVVVLGLAVNDVTVVFFTVVVVVVEVAGFGRAAAMEEAVVVFVAVLDINQSIIKTTHSKSPVLPSHLAARPVAVVGFLAARDAEADVVDVLVAVSREAVAGFGDAPAGARDVLVASRDGVVGVALAAGFVALKLDAVEGRVGVVADFLAATVAAVNGFFSVNGDRVVGEALAAARVLGAADGDVFTAELVSLEGVALAVKGLAFAPRVFLAPVGVEGFALALPTAAPAAPTAATAATAARATSGFGSSSTFSGLQ